MTMASEFDGRDFYVGEWDSNIEAGPTAMFYGSLKGLDYPEGVNGDVAVTRFAPPAETTIPTGSNYTAIVPGAGVDLDCEYLPGLNGTVAYLPWWSILGQ